MSDKATSFRDRIRDLVAVEMASAKDADDRMRMAHCVEALLWSTGMSVVMLAGNDDAYCDRVSGVAADCLFDAVATWRDLIEEKLAPVVPN